MIAMLTAEELDQACRNMDICPGCDKAKDPEQQLAVCWDCFKYRQDVTPLKYSGLSLGEWLEMIRTRN